MERRVSCFQILLGACRELALSKQESTTYEPSPVCKLLILGCRLLIPDRLLVTEVRSFSSTTWIFSEKTSGRLLLTLSAKLGASRVSPLL